MSHIFSRARITLQGTVKVIVQLLSISSTLVWVVLIPTVLAISLDNDGTTLSKATKRVEAISVLLVIQIAKRNVDRIEQLNSISGVNVVLCRIHNGPKVLNRI